jgi:hypothetical protein
MLVMRCWARSVSRQRVMTALAATTSPSLRSRVTRQNCGSMVSPAPPTSIAPSFPCCTHGKISSWNAWIAAARVSAVLLSGRMWAIGRSENGGMFSLAAFSRLSVSAGRGALDDEAGRLGAGDDNRLRVNEVVHEAGKVGAGREQSLDKLGARDRAPAALAFVTLGR